MQTSSVVCLTKCANSKFSSFLNSTVLIVRSIKTANLLQVDLQVVRSRP